MTASQILPHVTASLNGLSAILLVIAFILIRAGRRENHRAVMLAAMVVSALFLLFYLIYHFTAPIFVFPGQGAIRTAYYALLISHVVLSVAILPVIFITARRGLSGRFDGHRAIARWTWPLWMYVSLSGLAIYFMLYHLYPAA